MTDFLIIIGMAIATYSVRYPPLAAVGRMELSPAVRRALEFVPVAVLSAIILPAVIFPSGTAPQISWQNPYLIAG
ncbi:MAG: AzlD domain-containing protein, partial [Candidatus Promineifilaceae bacterium]|nr:AzlD domain-containing protein [Candidatus Promineifilaceae bacterium]